MIIMGCRPSPPPMPPMPPMGSRPTIVTVLAASRLIVGAGGRPPHSRRRNSVCAPAPAGGCWPRSPGFGPGPVRRPSPRRRGGGSRNVPVRRDIGHGTGPRGVRRGGQRGGDQAPPGTVPENRRRQRRQPRASGTPGYEASVDYVADKLARRATSVTMQTFEFPFFRETRRPGSSGSPRGRRPTATPTTSDHDLLRSGDVTAQVQGVDLVLPPARPRAPPPAARQPTSPGSCRAASR